MNVEELINKKKEEIIEEVKSETEGLHESISNTAVEKLEKFAAELKTVIDMNPIGAKDLLEVIEKGGIVYRDTIDSDGNIRVSNIRSEGMVDERILDTKAFNSYKRFRPNVLKGKQRVTIIIEPLEE